jgi:hypothetical protein
MIELLRLVFPYLLILYFVIKGLKVPYYFLGIPFLMFMSESIFFEGVKIFQIPGRLDFCLMFIWLIIMWIVSIIMRNETEKNEIGNTFRFNTMDYCIIGLLVISFIGLGLTIINYLDLTDVFKEFIVLISMFVCYFIIKNWSSHNKPEVLVKFIYCLVIINSFASLFYLLHQGLQFHIYKVEEDPAEVFMGAEITRTFWFMPQFLPLSIAYILVFLEKKSFVFYALLIVNLLAVFISYTRSAIINAAFIFLLYFLLVALKKGRIGLVIKNVLIYIVLGVLGFIMLSQIFPANTKYLVNRFTELTESSATSGPNNMEFRFIMTNMVISSMDEGGKILGMGPVSVNQISMVHQMRATTSDMVWTGVIYRWGFVGLMLFILLYIYSIFKSFFLYMKSVGFVSDLALLFLLFIISQIIESFVSWTFMSGHGFATGLWYFAMLSALIGFDNNMELSDKKKLSTE